MLRLFISYRRADSRLYVGRLYDRLVATFGIDHVFMDVNNNNIPLGSDFRDVLQESVNECDVFLALIGKQWLGITDKTGGRRIDNPLDFVRIEIETALKRETCRVIPVLVDGAVMPSDQDLPDSLKELAFKNAAIVRDDPDFHPDVNKIIQALESLNAAPQSANLRTHDSQPSGMSFDINDAIDRYHTAVDAKDWPAVRSILQEIRTSGKRLPRTFDLDAHENDMWLEIESQERDQEYRVVQRMARAATPNHQRIWEALQIFWESYPDYDPDDLARFKPLTAQEYFTRAEDARSDKKYQTAIGDYTECIRLDPQFATAYNNRGYSYYQLGEDDQALNDYSEAIRLNPRYANAYNNRGAFYNDKKDFQKAMADLNIALQLNPHYANAYHHRGNSHYALKDYKSAAADHEAALRYDPAHPYAAQALKKAREALKG